MSPVTGPESESRARSTTFVRGVAAVVIAAVVLKAPKSVLIASGPLVLLLFAQVGLSYLGRSSTEAAAWHIPNGVLAFGVATYLASRPHRTAREVA